MGDGGATQVAVGCEIAVESGVGGGESGREEFGATSHGRSVGWNEIEREAIAGFDVIERIDTLEVNGKQVKLPVMGVFELTSDGKIACWRDYFDMGAFTGAGAG